MLLITGGAGFVGQNLVRFFASRYSTIATYLKTRLPPDLETLTRSFQLEIKDVQAVSSLFEYLSPDVVIHLAGSKDVKCCETDPNEAYQVNTLGTQNVARACQRIGARLVYLSTDLVFGCTQGNYRETDVPHSPLVYGQTKLHGECIARQELDDVVICRSGGIYGWGSPLLRWVSSELTAGREVECFTDVYNTPTYVDNLAEMIQVIIERGLHGIFHTVGRERVNRWQFFRAYAVCFGLDASLLRPIQAGEQREKFLLQADASLSQEDTVARLGVRPNSVAEGMARLKSSKGA